jgi:tripartite-type tricarboxylate transporter receptor subunit TctC
VSGRTPVPLLPGVPTAIEAGYPDLDLVAWAGFLAPPGTPRAVVERVHAELAQVIASPEMEERLRAEGSALERLSPEAFRAYIRADQAKWVRIVKDTGITAEP